MSKIQSIASSSLLLVIFLTACNNINHRTESNLVNHKSKNVALEEKSTTLMIKNQQPVKVENSDKSNVRENPLSRVTDPITSQHSKSQSGTPLNKKDILVVTQPDSIPVLVNKQNKLPDSFTPKDLIYTNIPFIVSGRSERTKMRREASIAIEMLFGGAREQGIHLLGVSAYRSHVAQVDLFNYYAKRDGYEKARTYSALPGTSEHETGLSIDVTAGNGKCPAQDCFGYTIEAKWLQEHAAEYGFIIRYPKGKESITGYNYEPWHLRYIGKALAKDIMGRGITLEEYYGVVPVNQY